MVCSHRMVLPLTCLSVRLVSVFCQLLLFNIVCIFVHIYFLDKKKKVGVPFMRFEKTLMSKYKKLQIGTEKPCSVVEKIHNHTLSTVKLSKYLVSLDTCLNKIIIMTIEKNITGMSVFKNINA